MKRSGKATEQQRKASNPAVSAWVSANAGSGKTHVLVDRIIRLMLSGTAPSKILCVTFTKAAAAQMARRLFERLSAWATLSDEDLSASLSDLGAERIDAELLTASRRLLASALETPGGLKIQTIHAFCERLLQLYPVEAGVVPQFDVLEERAALELLRSARDAAFVDAMATPDSELGRAAGVITSLLQPDDFDGILAKLASERSRLGQALDGGEGLARAIRAVGAALDLAATDSEATILAGLAVDQIRYRQLAELLATGTTQDRNSDMRLRPLLGGAGMTLCELAPFYLTEAGKLRKQSGLATKTLVKAKPWIGDFLATELDRLDRGLAKLSDLARLDATRALLVVGSDVLRRYATAKRQAGAFDFDDLIAIADRLLESKPDAAWVLYKLDGGIEHVLIDEAQDTSPAQWNIITALTGEFFAGSGRHGDKQRTVFAVGDRKQSIYSFQGADPEIFELVRGGFRERAKAAGRRFRDLGLSVSFRSVPVVLEAVDLVFARDRASRRGLDGENAGDWVHGSSRDKQSGTVEIWPLVKPLDHPSPDPWTAPVDREPQDAPRRRLARHIAQTIEGWLGKRWLASKNRAVQAGDILILVQTRNSLFEAMIGELRRHGIAVAGADRLKLKSSLAVQDLLAALRVAVLPEDDYALACLLKSPVMAAAIGEEDLFRIAHDRGKTPLLQNLMRQAGEEFSAAAAQIASLLDAAKGASPHGFLSRVIAGSRQRFSERLGSEANDALDALLDAALDYEARAGTSLAGFLAWFESGDVEIKRNMEQEFGEVRIMTVHGAKGLEAPIVILPDTVATAEKRARDRVLMVRSSHGDSRIPVWLVPNQYESASVLRIKGEARDERQMEYWRQLYVAMTRAEDELYVCGYEGQRSQATESCWYTAVKEGLQPRLRSEGGVERMGEAPVFKNHEPYRSTPAPALPQWATTAPAPGPKDRPRGSVSRLAAGGVRARSSVSRGVLFHRILEHLPDCPPSERLNMARRMAAAAGHGNDIVEAIAALLETPEAQMLFGPDGISEVPLIVEIPERGLSLSGRIDRLIPGPDGILCVDYKSDAIWPATADDVRPEYLLQLAAYREALRQVHPHSPIRMALLWTSGPSLMTIADTQLDDAFDHMAVNRP